MMGAIYAVKCVPNGKAYVGQTTRSVTARFAEHIARGSYAIGAAVRKHGRDAFTVTALEHCETRADLDAAEAFWIEWYGTAAPAGYNLKAGGQASNHSPLTRAKISASRKGQTPHANTREAVRLANAARVVSAATRARMSASQTGHTLSVDARVRIGSANAARVVSDETRARITAALTGRPVSAETRAKISAARRRRP